MDDPELLRTVNVLKYRAHGAIEGHHKHVVPMDRENLDVG